MHPRDESRRIERNGLPVASGRDGHLHSHACHLQATHDWIPVAFLHAGGLGMQLLRETPVEHVLPVLRVQGPQKQLARQVRSMHPFDESWVVSGVQSQA